MFAKVFEQIFDSSIAEDWQVRHMFMDLLTLADHTGRVDMTPEAISRRTNVPYDVVCRCLMALEQPDPRSRNVINEGRRIVLLDNHRDWGWQIVNYTHYRGLATTQMLREAEAARKRESRRRNDPPQNTPVPLDVDVEVSGYVPGTSGHVPDNCLLPEQEKAIAMCANCGVPDAFIAELWTERMAANGLDGANRPITARNWPYYVKKRWNELQRAETPGKVKTEPESVYALSKRLEATEWAIKEITGRGTDHPLGWEPANEADRAERKRLIALRSELRRKLTGPGT
jgi:hypothetical protein